MNLITGHRIGNRIIFNPCVFVLQMIQLLYDIALRLGLGLILGVLLMILITIIETAFFNYHKQIHLLIVSILIALIIYALGDIGIDIFGI